VATASKAIPYAHITKDPKVCGGSACIDKTRIRVIDVVQAQSEGKTPEQIQELFAVKLSLAQVYSTEEGLRARDEYLKKHKPGQ
jgi:uncharacterized protein (DUF433 family)